MFTQIDQEEVLQKTRDDRNMRRNSRWLLQMRGSKGGWSSLDGVYDTTSEYEEWEDEVLEQESRY